MGQLGPRSASIWWTMLQGNRLSDWAEPKLGDLHFFFFEKGDLHYTRYFVRGRILVILVALQCFQL